MQKNTCFPLLRRSLRALALGLVLALLPAALRAQAAGSEGAAGTSGSKRAAFVWDLENYTRFNNTENDGLLFSFEPSETIFANLLTPQAGVELTPDGQSRHRFMLGLNYRVDFGSKSKPYGEIQNVLAYYRLERFFGEGRAFSVTAGIHPSSLVHGRYDESFLSDDYVFGHPQRKGLLFGWEQPGLEAQLGCDWLGMYEAGSRERFLVYSTTGWQPLDWLETGYVLHFYHFACSPEVDGVVDNSQLKLYAGFTPLRDSPLDLYVELAWLGSYQRDRIRSDRPDLPFGGQVFVDLSRKGLGLKNTFYVGKSLQPYFQATDAAGEVYGDRLYFGCPYYQLSPGSGAGFHDRVELYWEPRLCRGVDLEISLQFHFCGGFNPLCAGLCGTTQVIGLKADLNEILGR